MQTITTMQEKGSPMAPLSKFELELSVKQIA